MYRLCCTGGGVCKPAIRTTVLYGHLHAGGDRRPYYEAGAYPRARSGYHLLQNNPTLQSKIWLEGICSINENFKNLVRVLQTLKL
jgi:hypothetical protein